MQLKCIIIDDESHAIEGLKRYIETMPELEIVKSYTEPLVALKEISTGEPVDIIFLDVDMPMINGLELAKEIRNKTQKLVFTTGHTDYAYQAFEANADAYLLKPFSLGKFAITVNKLFPDTTSEILEVNTSGTRNLDYFFIKAKAETTKIVKIHFNDVIYVESKEHNLHIVTLKETYITSYMTLTEISKALAGHPEFIQLHRSYIVNEKHIESISGNCLKMANRQEIMIGDFYRKNFNDFLQVRALKGTKK